MRNTSLVHAAPRRNRNDFFPILGDDVDALTSGGREIQRRTGWSAPLSNAVAAIAGIGPTWER